MNVCNDSIFRYLVARLTNETNFSSKWTTNAITAAQLLSRLMNYYQQLGVFWWRTAVQQGEKQNIIFFQSPRSEINFINLLIHLNYLQRKTGFIVYFPESKAVI